MSIFNNIKEIEARQEKEKLYDEYYKAIILNEDYRQMIPLASADEREEIRKSLQKHGQKYPVTVDATSMELVDGYTRYDELKKLNMPVWYVRKFFKSRTDIINFILVSNVHRRHLRPFDKVRLFRPLFDLEKKEAQERLKNISKHRVKGEGGKAIDKFSKKIGVSPSTAEKALVVIDRGSQKQIEAIKSGKESLTRMYNVIVKKKDYEPEKKHKYEIVIKNNAGKKLEKFNRMLTEREYNNLLSYIRVL